MPRSKLTTLELLGRLIAFDTTSSRSNLPLIDAVADYLDGYGVPVSLIRDPRAEKANLFATVGAERDGGIVLSGHSDCVPVEGQEWSRDPFQAVTEDGRVYGRGACDMKGFLAAVLARVPDMIAVKLKTPLHLAFSYDEEVGCRGVPRLLAELAKELPQPRVAIVGEPTGMQAVAAHKGIYTFETVVTGLEAHSSATQRGVSAIAHGAEIVGFLDDLAREFAAQGPFDEAFDPPYTTVNVGVIAGGTAVNIIPRHCRIDWEFRPVPGHSPEAIQARVARFVEEEVLSRMRERHPGASITTRPGAAAPPLMRSGAATAETLVRALDATTSTLGVSFATEAGLFQRAGVSAVVIGPGFIEQAHKPDEYVSMTQLEACESFLDRIVAHAAENGPGA